MSVAVFIPTPLRRYSGGATEISLPSEDIASLLNHLEREFPKLHRSICDDTGAVRRHINIFVNEDHIRDLNGTETSLDSGDVVTIMTAVSGG